MLKQNFKIFIPHHTKSGRVLRCIQFECASTTKISTVAGPGCSAFINSLRLLVTFVFFSAGDGRMDSPGHCAQYCSYTMMENTTKKIVTLETMDKRQTGGKSCSLKKECFIKAMANLNEKQMDVGEIVSDAHMQITALMSKFFFFFFFF